LPKANPNATTTMTSPIPSRRTMLTGASAAILAGAVAVTVAHVVPAVPVGATIPSSCSTAAGKPWRPRVSSPTYDMG
jgi:hypothetical protein